MTLHLLLSADDCFGESFELVGLFCCGPGSKLRNRRPALFAATFTEAAGPLHRSLCILG